MEGGWWLLMLGAMELLSHWALWWCQLTERLASSVNRGNASLLNTQKASYHDVLNLVSVNFKVALCQREPCPIHS